MSSHPDRTLDSKRLVDAWELIQQSNHVGQDLQPDSYRLAFSDPEFLLRRELRGVRLQLEMLKPEVAQQQYQIEHTIVVYGSARVQSAEAVEALLATARQFSYILNYQAMQFNGTWDNEELLKMAVVSRRVDLV